MGPAVWNILVTTVTLHTIKRAIGRSSLSSSFQLSPPPTSVAAKQHPYRSYLTVIMYKKL